MIRRWLAVFTLVSFAGAAGNASRAQRAQVTLDELFARYQAGDPQALASTPELRRSFRAMLKELPDTLDRWERHRRPSQGAFLLEFIRTGLVDFNEATTTKGLAVSQAYIMRRTNPPGKNPAEDALEITWHKAALGLVEGLRDLRLLDDTLGPLRRRMTTAPAAGGRATLVDPWIALVDGIAIEIRTFVDPRVLPREGPAAIRRFDEAAKYPDTRAEATVRKAALLVRMGDHAGALAALDAGSDPGNDSTVRCWRALLRGRALEGLGRLDDAASAYGEALIAAPNSSSALAALAAVELRRGRTDIAVQWAAQGRARTGAATDPWLLYGTADFRLYRERIEILRQAR
jgi:hypothetical protein